jgi:hypothetical protein
LQCARATDLGQAFDDPVIPKASFVLWRCFEKVDIKGKSAVFWRRGPKVGLALGPAWTLTEPN